MSTYIEIKQIFKRPLTDIAKELGYPDSTICVLSGDEELLKEKYPETYANAIECKHHRDSRTPMQYAMDLSASWLMEDFIIRKLRDCGLDIRGAGNDKERSLLPSTKVASANSDCIVEHNGIIRNVEIMNDYKGYWSRFHKIDLRDDKYSRLKRDNTIFLGISTKDRKYILIDFSKESSAVYIPYHFAYNKPAYSIVITQEMLHNLSFKDIVETIEEFSVNYLNNKEE